MEIKTKKCNGCLKEKELYYFTRVYRNPDGLCHMCRDCVKSRKSPTMKEIMRKHSPQIFSSFDLAKKKGALYNTKVPD